MSSVREQERKSLFKKQHDLEHGRRRREETTTQLRKAKKEDQLAKRRQIQVPPAVANNGDIPVADDKDYDIADIPKLMSLLESGNTGYVLKAVRGFRRMLSVEQNPPANEIISAGAMPHLLSCLRSDSDPELLFEASWALTNIASTNKTQVVVDAGAIYPLVALLGHQEGIVREQAAWCLGNIAGESLVLRDQVLEAGALPGLLLNIKEPANASVLGTMTWVVSNLCKGKNPAPDPKYIGPVIGVLARLVGRSVSIAVRVDAIWALSYLADGDNDRIQRVMETGVAKDLVNVLEHEHMYNELLTPTVRCLGNFVTGTVAQTSIVVDFGVTQHARQLLHHPKQGIRKETLWMLSNIAAGTCSQIATLFHEPGLLDRIVEMGTTDLYAIRREAVWVLTNIFTCGSESHVRNLVGRQGLLPITAILKIQDVKIVSAALDAIEQVLIVNERLKLTYTILLEEIGAIDEIEDLQQHPDDVIYHKAIAMIERFFGHDDEEDENLAPSTANDGTFVFGISQPLAKNLFPDDNDMATSPTANKVFGSNLNNFGARQY